MKKTVANSKESKTAAPVVKTISKLKTPAKSSSKASSTKVPLKPKSPVRKQRAQGEPLDCEVSFRDK